jgi:hypothetical protein
MRTLILKICNYMEYSPYCETNSSSASEEISRFLCKPKVHYRINKSPLVAKAQVLHISFTSTIGVATGYGLDDRLEAEFESRWDEEFSLFHVETGSGAHPASYSMGTGCSFPGGKAAGA